MPSTLDKPLTDLFDDRPLLHRVVRCISLDQDLSYVQALDKLHSGADSASDSRTPTLRNALEWVGADLGYVEDGLRLLERRDQAIDQAFKRAAGPLVLEQPVDQHGRVMLEQSGALAVQPATAASLTGRGLPTERFPSGRRMELLKADIGEVLANPAEQERRLARMRKAQPGVYDGDDGRATFKREDRLHAEAGHDMVATAERNQKLAGARVAADRVGAELDAAIAAAADKRQKLKRLDAQLVELEGKAPGVEFNTARDQLRSRAAAAGREEPLKLLDQLSALDKAAAGEKAPSPTMAEIDERTRAWTDHLEQLRQTQTPDEFLKTLDAAFAGEPLPTPPAANPGTPAGVHPGSHLLDQRVRERMRELDRPESEYAKTLAEIMAEGG